MKNYLQLLLCVAVLGALSACQPKKEKQPTRILVQEDTVAANEVNSKEIGTVEDVQEIETAVVSETSVEDLTFLTENWESVDPLELEPKEETA